MIENTCRECDKKVFTKKDLNTMLQFGISTCYDCHQEGNARQLEDDWNTWGRHI
jgi:hypothetical protein